MRRGIITSKMLKKIGCLFFALVLMINLCGYSSNGEYEKSGADSNGAEPVCDEAAFYLQVKDESEDLEDYVYGHHQEMETVFSLCSELDADEYQVEITAENMEVLSDTSFVLPGIQQSEIAVTYRSLETGEGNIAVAVTAYADHHVLGTAKRTIYAYATEEQDYIDYNSQDNALCYYVYMSNQNGTMSDREYVEWMKQLHRAVPIEKEKAASNTASTRANGIYITLGSRKQDDIEWDRTNYLTRHRAIQNVTFGVYSDMELEAYDIEISGDNIEILSDKHIECEAGDVDEITDFTVQFRTKDTGYGELRIDVLGSDSFKGVDAYADTYSVEIYAYDEGDFFIFSRDASENVLDDCVEYSLMKGALTEQEADAYIEKMQNVPLADFFDIFSLSISESNDNEVQDEKLDMGMNCLPRYKFLPLGPIILIIAAAIAILIGIFLRKRKS